MASAATVPSILELRHSITDDNIIAPESFETQTRLLEENFYLKNYVVPGVDTGNSTTATPAEYEQRLTKLPTVIDLPYNSIVKNYIEMYLTRRRGLVADMLALHNYYGRFFEEELLKEGMPVELEYLPVIESAINPNAVSRAGAVGLWQFMPATAKGLGMEINSLVDERRDPRISSRNAARYLKQLHDIYNDWSLAIAAYNCGPGNVNKALRRAGGGKKDFWAIYPFLPAETRGYVPAFIAANYVMTYYPDHNIARALVRRPLVVDSVHVSRRVHFEQISEVLGISMDELRALNPQYRKDVIPGHIRPYALVLPSLQTYAYIANEDSIINHNAANYLLRDVVEPATGASVQGSDSHGEYVDETVVKYHKVRRGETVSSIARRYGITQSALRSANGLGRKSKVRRGMTLKIVTTTRKYLPKPAPADSIQVEPAPADSLQPAPAATVPDSAAPSAQASEVARAMEQSAAPAKAEKPKSGTKSKAKAKPKATTHKVRSGDSLYKLAKRYGVSVKAIKDANNLRDSDIKIGQKLKIPAKK